MAITGGPTVTLKFKGDTDDLERSIERVQTWVTRIGIAGAGVAAGAAAGAAAAALAIAGLPALFAGIGIAAAAQSQRVKDAFTSLKDHVVAQAQQMAAPFEPVLVGIANKAQATFDRIGPSLSRIFSDVAPMVDRLATAVLKFIEGAMPGFERAMDKAGPVVDALARGIERMGPAIGDFFAKISEQSGSATEAMNGLFDVVIWLVGALGDILAFCLKWKDVLIPLGIAIAGVAVTIKTVSAAVKAWEIAQAALNIVMAANPIGLVVVALAALAAGLIYAYQHSETFRNIVNGAFEAVKNAAQVVWDHMVAFGHAIGDIWNAAADIVRGAVDRLRAAVEFIHEIPEKVSAWFTQAKDAAIAKFHELQDWVNGFPARLRDGLASLATILLDKGKELVQGLWDGAKAVFGDVLNWVRGWIDSIINAIGDAAGKMYEAGAKVSQGFADGINSKADAAKDAAGHVVGGTEALFPQSPAKEGPFSGEGWTFYRGQSLIEGFMSGIADMGPRLSDIARSVLDRTSVALHGFTSPGSGGTARADIGGVGSVELKVAPGADSALSSMLMNLVRTGQLQLARA